MEPKIDDGFRDQIARITSDEYAILKESIIANGCLDPLKVWAESGVLLDGHHRYEICQKHGIEFNVAEITLDSREAAEDWIDANQLGRRNLTKDQFKYLIGRRYNRAKKARGRPNKCDQNDHINTSKALAVEHGIGEATVRRAGKFTELVDATPEMSAAIKEGKPAAKAKKEADRRAKAEDLDRAVEAISEAAKADIAAVCEIRTCPCRELLSSFNDDNRPDIIITDPPYPHEYISVFSELAETAAFANIPIVAVMSGQTYLPEVYRRLSEYLKYRWTMVYLMPGGQATQAWTAKANTSWKPILIYGEAAEWFGDVAKSDANDKDHHKWGQSVSGMADIVDRLSSPGDLVCDPFVGGGTTAVACIKTGRRFVGCDIDQESVDTATMRVEAISCRET